METDLQKQLRIKTGVLKRMIKEHQNYVKEEAKLKEKQAELMSTNQDELTLRKHKEFLDETQSVLPNCLKRLKDAFEDLSNWINDYGDNIVIKDTEPKEQAQTYLIQGQEYIEALNIVKQQPQQTQMEVEE